MNLKIYIDGNFYDQAYAKISVFDHGLLYGLATIAAAGNPKYLEGFGPRVEGFDTVPLGDIEAAKAAIGPQTGAILIEHGLEVSVGVVEGRAPMDRHVQVRLAYQHRIHIRQV